MFGEAQQRLLPSRHKTICIATESDQKPGKIVLKGSFSRRISKLKLPKHQILKLAHTKRYNAILPDIAHILLQCQGGRMK
jgi:hypothetical protein